MNKNNFFDEQSTSFKMGLIINEEGVFNKERDMYFHAPDYLASFEFEKFSTSINPYFGIDYDEREKKYFVFLLSRSISISKEEKIDILFDRLPCLSSFQINELVKVFEEERTKFILLSRMNSNTFNEICKEKAKALKEWVEIEEFCGVGRIWN
ncbi:MAG: hypothetical protein U0354_13960 [Candidatus Sericytochromatia bacterium]